MTPNWKKCILNINSKIIDVINNLDKTGQRIVLVIDDKKNFVGTVNDGDIRRAIKKKIPQDEKIIKIVNKNPFTVSSINSRVEAFNKMTKFNVNQVPIILKKKIIGIFTLEEILSKKKIDNIFFLMSGGKGLRLGKLTKKIPKPMLEIGDIPIMERIILKAKAEGFKNFISSVNYKKQSIIKYFQNGKVLGVNLNYIKEKENRPLGTAGSLGHLKDIHSPIIVSNSDVLIDINYSDLLDFHYKNNSEITLVTKINETRSSFGEVKIKNNRIIELIEKPILKKIVLTGVYVLNPSIIKKIKKNIKLDMTDLIISNIRARKKVFSYLISEDWIDIGNHQSLGYAKKNFK